MAMISLLEERSLKCSMPFTKAKSLQLLTLFLSNIGSTIISLRMDGQSPTLMNKKPAISTETSLKKYRIFDHSESTSIFKSNNVIWRMLTANGLLQHTTRSFACRCWRCHAEISNTSMTSSTFTSMELAITIVWWILRFNGVSQITSRQKCPNTNALKSSPNRNDYHLKKSYKINDCIPYCSRLYFISYK